MSGRGGDGFQYQSSRSNYRGRGHRGGGRGRGGEGGYRGGRGGYHSQYESTSKQPYQSQPQQQPQQQAPPAQQPPAAQQKPNPQSSQTPNPAAKEFKSKLPQSVSNKFDVPVRTSSAPPNLQEQEKHVHKKEFFPHKASIPFVPAQQYPPYYQPPFQQPFEQSAAPVKPAATTASPQPQKKRGLAIVDPNTGTDILTGEKVMEVKPEEPKKAEAKTEETKEPETAPKEEDVKQEENEDNEEEEGDEMEDDEGEEEEEEEDEDKEEESGKRIYSKEFLLRFKDKFTQPPESLLHSEIFTGRTAGDLHKYPVSPKPQRGGRGGRGGNKRGGGRGGGRGGRGGKTPAKKAAWAVAKNEEEAVSKDALFILNKLAPETYTKLLEQFVKLPITTPEILKQVIYTIYDKAVYEPNFGSLYADLCSDLSQKLKVGQDTASAAFKKILLNRCQEEFEQKAASQQPVEGEKEPTPEEKEEKEMKQRKRMVGNIIFIGELFKKKMLSEKIMHEVIKTLLVAEELPTPDNLELLAKLLTTIGQLLDHEKASKFMDFYFSKLKALSTNKAIPSRNRYLIIDVLELRENAWVPRIKKETAKTKKEVHKEAEQEKLEQERIMREKAQKLGITSSRGGGRGGGRGRGYDTRESRENKEKKGSQGGQEWTKAKRYTSGSIKAPSESRLAPPEKSSGAGSAGWGGVAQSNAFAALMEDENAMDETSQDSEAAPENVEESGKMEGEPLSEEELAKKMKSIIGNFTESGDEDDAMKDIKELVATKKYIVAKYLIKAAVEESNEQNFKDAQTIIVRTAEEKYFKSTEFTKAAQECYKNMIENDVHIEAPVQLRQFAEVCGRLVGTGSLHLDHVDDIVSSQSSVGGATLAEMLPFAYHGVRRHYEIIEADFKAIIKEFSATKLNVLKFINPSRSLEVDKFVNNMKKFKLEEMEPVSGILTYMQSQKDVDDVIAFVEDKLPDSHATTEKLMGAIITAVEISTMFARGKSNPEEEEKAMFEQYGKLLDSLTGSVDNQVILLNELQRFCSRTGFAKDVMGRLFKLFKNRWVYEEAIETWKKDDSIEGHAKALESIAE